MRTLCAALILCAAAALGGCAQLTTAYDLATGSVVSSTDVIVAANVFDGLEATATNYLRLKPCTGANGPVCRFPQATAPIVAAVRSGRTARNNLEAAIKASPNGAITLVDTYSALKTAIAQLQSIYSTYAIGG